MDQLSGTLHLKILSSLARSHAALCPDEEPLLILSKLPLFSSASSSLATFDPKLPPSPSHHEHVHQSINAFQSHHAMAYAAYVTHYAATHSSIPPKALDTLCDLLLGLASSSFHPGFGTDSGVEWPLVDQLTYRLLDAALGLGHLASAQGREIIVKTLAQLLSQVNEQFFQVPLIRAIAHFLPVLSGIRRALSQSRFPFTLDDFARLFPSISTSPLLSPSAEQLGKINSNLTGSFGLHLEDNRLISRVKARYDRIGTPLSGHMILQVGLQQCRNVLESCLANHQSPPTSNSPPGPCNDEDSGWSRLLLLPTLANGAGSGSSAVQASTMQSAALFLQYCDIYQRNLVSEEAQDSVVEIICEAIKLSTLSALTLGVVTDPVFEQLLALHSEKAIVIHPSVQTTATESLVILARNFPSLVDSIAQTLRSYLTSPLPPPDLTPPSSSEEVGQSLLAAAYGLSVCLRLTDSEEFTRTTMHALLNHINTTDPTAKEVKVTDSDVGLADRQVDTISPAPPEVVSLNALHALVALLKQNNPGELTSTMVALLLLRSKGAAAELQAEIMLSIVDLALDVDEQRFKDIISTLSTLYKGLDAGETAASSEAIIGTGIYRVQMKLSSALFSRNDLSELYLIELLTLFIGRGKAVPTNQTRPPNFQKLLCSLGPVVSVIGNLLRSSSGYNPRLTASTQLSQLFRSFWYICVFFGFLSSPTNARLSDGTLVSPPDWLTLSLRQIAAKSPTLTHLTSVDYLTTQVDHNPILKLSDMPLCATPSKLHRHESVTSTSAHYIAVEQAKKVELASLIPAHSGQIRGFSFAQTILLLTIARLEVFRAEDCRAATILEYLGHVSPGEVDIHDLFGCLATVSEKVLYTFICSFQQRAIRHEDVPHVYQEIPQVLKATCHSSARIRSIALRYCQDMITAFPTLLCHFETVRYMLELLTLLRISCEGEYEDEYFPQYVFRSEVADLSVVLSDDYTLRQQILDDLHQAVKHWLALSIARAPLEMKSIFMRYLDGVATTSVGYSLGKIEMGKSIALEFAKSLPSNSQLSTLPSWGNWNADVSNDFARSFSNRMFYSGQAKYLSSLTDSEFQVSLQQIKAKLEDIFKQLQRTGKRASPSNLTEVLYKAGSHILACSKPNFELLSRIVSIPIRTFTPVSISLGLDLWTWLIDVKPEVESKLMVEVINMWSWTIRHRKGFFSNTLDLQNPVDQSIQFTPTDREEMHHRHNVAKKTLKPHSILIYFILSRFQATRYKSRVVVMANVRLLKHSFAHVQLWSQHPLTRELRTRLIIFGFSLCQGSRMEDTAECCLRDLCYSAAFDWFSLPCSFSFASNRLQHQSELRLLQELLEMVKVDQPVNAFHITSLDSKTAQQLKNGRMGQMEATVRHTPRNHLLRLLLEHEISRLMTWYNPLNDPKKGKDPEIAVYKSITEARWRDIVEVAWKINPALCVRLAERFKNPCIDQETSLLVKTFPHQARKVPEALSYFLSGSIRGGVLDPLLVSNFHSILYWKKIPVVTTLSYFLPPYENDPVILQYTMRVLEEHPVDVAFFYIPQVVQALRTDKLGYVQRFIFKTAQVSQLFCHQIIWNMKANTFKGDDAVEADPMKPTLDRTMSAIVGSLSGEAKTFYEVEFKFFDEITGISKTLRDYLRKDKAEKKAKIGEELSKIKVVKGVYLPSNPDGTVIDIDRSSGRPLQSHAKTPFMATFKVHREKVVHAGDGDDDNDDEELAEQKEEEKGGGGYERGEGTPGVEKQKKDKKGVDTWQAAMFKVGDDCRQDLLALQLIAIHKTIYEGMCLDLHLVPYRVTATAPGCGVIDVIPNATSRDEMGRAKINDLNSFFIGKFGPPDSVSYQKARMNFVRSMAAYSVMCYLIQIKDRHNGNIMIDGDGHITHVDFGFLFDIGPGGIKFEPNSFKLTGEMIVLMGGQNSAGFRYFQELVVKAFLVARPFAKEIVSCVKLMSESQLPSFKGEGTMNRLLDRFKPLLSEREAAVYMQGVIGNAKQNGLSLLYDEFQWVTNEIPYTQRDWIARAA